LTFPKFERPQFQVVRADTLPLSSEALLDLMSAVLAKGVPFRFYAKGWSMAPFIKDGDVITVSPLKSKPVTVGEVLAFRHPQLEKLVVHRSIAKQGAAVLIRGDHVENYADGLVPMDGIIGRVTKIERNKRQIWIGLGPERYMIAWLSRFNLLIPLYNWLSKFPRCRARKKNTL
jgi:signal peptidase I